MTAASASLPLIRRDRSYCQTDRCSVRSKMRQQKRNQVDQKPDLRAERESEWQCDRPKMPSP